LGASADDFNTLITSKLTAFTSCPEEFKVPLAENVRVCPGGMTLPVLENKLVSPAAACELIKLATSSMPAPHRARVQLHSTPTVSAVQVGLPPCERKGRAEVFSKFSTVATDADGSKDQYSEAAPATMGAEKLVPILVLYVLVNGPENPVLLALQIGNAASPPGAES